MTEGGSTASVAGLVRIADALRLGADASQGYADGIAVLKEVTGARAGPTYVLDQAQSELILMEDAERALIPPGFDTMPAALHIRSPWLNEEDRPVSARDHLRSRAWLDLPEEFRQWFGPSGIVVSLRAEGRHIGAVLLVFDGDYEMSGETAEFLTVAGRLLGAVLEGHRLRMREREMAILDERRRLADELHAGLSQDVAAMGLALSTLRLDVKGGRQPAGSELMSQDIGRLDSLVASMRRDLRMQMLGLRREAEIRRSGLFDQARSCVDQFSRQSGVPATFETSGTDESLPLAVASPVVYVLQEALNNVALHAQASSARVTVDCASTRIRLDVIDDGSGFDPYQVDDSRLGLRIMREMLAQIDGRLMIRSRPDQGTRLTAEAPSRPIVLPGRSS